MRTHTHTHTYSYSLTHSLSHSHTHTHAHTQLEDVPDAPLLPALDRAVDILADNERRGDVTLVHCVVGASRSASIVIAYVTGNCRQHACEW